VKVSLCERTPCLSASQSLIIFQFYSLVVSLSEIAGTCFHVAHAHHLALKGLKNEITFSILFYNLFIFQ